MDSPCHSHFLLRNVPMILGTPLALLSFNEPKLFLLRNVPVMIGTLLALLSFNQPKLNSLSYNEPKLPFKRCTCDDRTPLSLLSCNEQKVIMC